MDMKYLIGLDIGTSAVKGVLMTEEGTVIHSAGAPFVYTTYDNGGVEIEAITACRKLHLLQNAG